MSAGCAMPCGWEATADQDKSPRGCPLIGLIAASGVWRGCGPPAPVLDPPPPPSSWEALSPALALVFVDWGAEVSREWRGCGFLSSSGAALMFTS